MGPTLFRWGAHLIETRFPSKCRNKTHRLGTPPADWGPVDLPFKIQTFEMNSVPRGLQRRHRRRLQRAESWRTTPRPWNICGRKRWGWKREFLESLAEAAKDIGEISEEENLRTVRSYRRESRAPEITVAAELEGASRGPSLTRVCLPLAFRVSESPTFPAEIQVPVYFTSGPRKTILPGSIPKLFGMSTRKF